MQTDTQQPEIQRAADTVDEFCISHRISRPMFYKLLKAGKGPRIIKLGRRTLISKESAAKWRASLENQEVIDHG